MEHKNHNDGTEDESYWQAKREYPRAKARCVVKYQIFGATDEKYEVSTTKDLSAGGIRFTSHKEFAKGTILHLEILIPPKPTEITVRGEVMWVKQIRRIYENGVKFIKIELTEQDLIKGFVSKLLGKPE